MTQIAREVEVHFQRIAIANVDIDISVWTDTLHELTEVIE